MAEGFSSLIGESRQQVGHLLNLKVIGVYLHNQPFEHSMTVRSIHNLPPSLAIAIHMYIYAASF